MAEGGGRRIGSVKAAINMYGQRATQFDLPEAKVRPPKINPLDLLVC